MEALKANELRIGNYFDEFRQIRIANGGTIALLEESPITQLWCKPIPLTEKWLIKFGFEKTYAKNCHKKRFNKNSLHSIVVTIGKENILCLLDEYSGKEIIMVFNGDVIESVHQLQNIYFALTGKELTI